MNRRGFLGATGLAMCAFCDWPATPARGAQPDIRCRAQRWYQGNFTSPVAVLNIHGPEQGTWSFQVTNDFSGTLQPPLEVKTTGTYELIDDLAVFQGKMTSNNPDDFPPRQLKFGLNYGRIGGEIHFNKFFPGGDAALRCHRRWFAKVPQGWRLVEERVVEIPVAALKQDADVWHVLVTGQRSHWDQSGSKTTKHLEQELAYHKTPYRSYALKKRPSVPWLPRYLRPHVRGGRLEAISIADEYIEDVRGFHPRLAERPVLPEAEP